MDSHTHSFTKLGLAPIKRVQKDYKGLPGDKAFITKACECGKVKAIEYGITADMEVKLKELEKA